MKQFNNKLEQLLFNNNEDFNTQSVYQSLGLERNDQVTFDQNNAEIDIRNKLNKIGNSFKSLNFSLNTYFPGQYALSNKFVSSILDVVIELIWKLEEEYNSKINYVSKIGTLNLKLEDSDKKYKKCLAEIAELKRQQNEQVSLLNRTKEKDSKNKTKEVNEIKELQLQTRKLTSLIESLKVETKKKDTEIGKLKEKVKKFLACGEGQIKGTIELVEDENSKIIASDFLLSPKHNPFLDDKINFLQSQNEALLRTAKGFKQFIDRFCKRISQTSLFSMEEQFLDLVKIKDSMFSIHIIGKNLEEFENNFKNNLNTFDKVLSQLIQFSCSKPAATMKIKNEEEIVLDDTNPRIANDAQSVSANVFTKSKAKDILGNFKKWSLANGNEKFLYSSGNKKLTNEVKWYENIDQEKKIIFEFDQDNLIKGDSYLNSEHNN